MKNRKTATEYFEEGHNCAQAVYAATAPTVDEATCLKAGAAFGGGMARVQMVCGAVTGALMALGHKFGPARAPGEKENLYKMSNEFMNAFKFHHGSVTCRDLLGEDMHTEEGKKRIKEGDLYHTVCTRVVSDAAKMVNDIIKAQSKTTGS